MPRKCLLFVNMTICIYGSQSFSVVVDMLTFLRNNSWFKFIVTKCNIYWMIENFVITAKRTFFLRVNCRVGFNIVPLLQVMHHWYIISSVNTNMGYQLIETVDFKMLESSTNLCWVVSITQCYDELQSRCSNIQSEKGLW